MDSVSRSWWWVKMLGALSVAAEGRSQAQMEK